MKKRTTTLSLALLLLAATLALAVKMVDFEVTEPLEGAEVVELQMDLALAETVLEAGDPGTLVRFNGRYDADHMEEPTLEVERSGNEAFVYLESDDKGDFFGSKGEDKKGGDFTVQLSPEPEYSLRCEVGLGDSDFDLTGLKIRRLDLESGLAESRVTLSKPNPIELDKVNIECGLGSVHTEGFGYLRFRKLVADLGMGELVLDLTGFEGKGQVEISVGMGDCELIVPRGVGVVAYYDGGFMSDVDLDDMREVRDGVWKTKNADDAENLLELDLSVGMGSLDLRWE